MGSLTVAAAVLTALPAPALAAEPLQLNWEWLTDGAKQFAADAETVVYEIWSSTQSETRLLVRDLRTGAERELARPAGGIGNLQLSGEYALYTTYVSGEWAPMLYNLQTDESRQLRGTSECGFWLAAATVVRCTPGTFVPAPDDSGSGEYVDFALRQYDAVAGTERELTRIPRISLFGKPIAYDGDFLVYTEQEQLVALDLTTNERHARFMTNAITGLKMEAGRVLYVTSGDAGHQIRLWNVADGTDRELSAGTTAYDRAEIDLHNNRVAWIIGEGAERSLHLLDLTTGKETETVVGPPTYYPVLTDRHVFFSGQGTPQMALLDATSTPAPQPQPEEPAQPVFHTVAEGEVLWRIAARYEVPVTELIRANNMLNPNWIYPGQKLFVPYPVSPRFEAYTVKSGDTLARVAAQFGTTVSSIRAINQLTENPVLNIGQVLQVARGPEAAPADADYRWYAVMPGDAVWNIAHRLGIPVKQLMTLNNMQIPRLLIGDGIKVPK